MNTSKFIALSGAIFTTMFVTLSHIAEYLFFQPILILHVPQYAIIEFSLIVVVSALTGLILSMGIQKTQLLKSFKKEMSNSIVGPIIGASAGLSCCGAIGFALVSTFGTVGVTATTFLLNYEIPIRLVSIGILAVTLFYMTRLNVESTKPQLSKEILN